MPANILICTYIHDATVAKAATTICAAQGWTIWQRNGENDHALDLEFLPKSPDIIIFDRADRFGAVRDALDFLPQAQGVYIGEPIAHEHVTNIALLARDAVKGELVNTITTALNIARFEAQFFSVQATEPITRLPHHPELLDFMERFQGAPTGLLVVQVDHAEHLYANLDPVSKTDLLGALSDHLSSNLPHAAYMGIYDAGAFVVWCPQMSLGELHTVAENCIAQSRQPLVFRGGELHFSLSIGHAYDQSLFDAQALWQRAWQAKEQARSRGGNRTIAAELDPGLGVRVPEALRREEFSLVLQPQWNITGEHLHGVESLLRWEGMEVGNLAPDHFIPVVERSGEMARVGDWVLEHAACESTTWLEHLVSPIYLGINISPQQFTHNAIKNQIMRLSKEQWLDPAILELEMSHANLLHVVDQHRTELFELRDLGVRIAIDNLGTGVVDTKKLLRCPADTLKIDRSLIASLETDASARTLIEQICRVGQRFQLRVVAVGVETEEQRRILEDLGCTDVQGFLFSSPVPLDEFQRLLTERRAPRISTS